MLEFKPKKVIFLSTSINGYFKTIKESMDYLLGKRGAGGIYVALTRPSDTMAKRLRRDNPLRDVFFLDCVSHMAGEVPKPKEHTLYLESPTMLETILVKVDALLRKVKSRDKFVFVDSINAIAIYNDQKILTEFLHRMVNNFGGKEMISVLLSVREQTPEDVDNMLMMICDEIVEVE